MSENQNSFSPEKKEEIRKKFNDSRQKERLRGCYQKVVKNGIERNNHRSYERAVWELMQNAGDQSDHAVIKMKLSNDEFCFSHKGEPFKMTTLCNLVEQQSSKSEEDDNVGQYGTGFMVTYSLSRKVHIEGYCKIEDKRVPLDFWLDRTYDDEETFIEELEKELKLIDKLIDERYTDSPNDWTSNDWTSFTYSLDQEKSIKIKDRIEKTIHLMPFVLVFNDKIAECSIISSGRTTKYTKGLQECNEADGKNYRKVVTQIEITKEGEPRTVEIVSIESIDGYSRVIVPPLPSGFDAVKDIPSQFLFFPLLGTENFGINFIFHSSKLYPVGDRDSYLLPNENDSSPAKAKSNEDVLNEMIDMLFNYYRDNPSAQNLPLDFAEVSFKYYKEGDPKTKEFYEKLQNKFSDEFQGWRMIPTMNGYKSIRDADHPKVLSPEFYKSLEEQIGKHLPVIQEFAARFFVIPQKDIVEWSKVVYGWNPNESNYYIKLEDICRNIKEESEHLKDFLLYLKDLGKTDDLANQYPLIPNRKAELKSSKDLKDGKTINPALYEIASPIIGDKADKIVDEEYSDIVDLSKYTREDLLEDVESSIRRWRNDYIRPHKLMEDDVRVRTIIRYCSAYKNTSEMEDADKYRDELMPVICAFYNDVEYKRQEIPSHSPDERDLYGDAFDFLIDYTLLMISQKLRLGDNDNRNLLLTFLKKLAKGNDELKKKIKDYAVIPNQLSELKEASKLRLADFEYKEEIIELYKEAFSQDENETVKDLRAELVHEDFKDIYGFDKYGGDTVGGKIEDRLEKIEYKNNAAVPKIIRNLDDPEKGKIWKKYFPKIEKNKYRILYAIGKPEDLEALYIIQMKGSDAMQAFAKLADRDDCDAILQRAIDIIIQKQKDDRDYNFKLRIGKLIENEIRKEISNIGEFSVYDVQPEQDIVISYNGEDLYYIECKAKWNFSDPAHMSSPQIKKAVREKERYALFCVDLTDETGCKLSPEASEEEVAAAHDDIIANTHVHTDIGERLGVVKTLVEYEKNVDSNKDISIDSERLSCNIPKRVFNQGKTFKDFIQELKKT